MGNTKDTGFLRNLISYDSSGNIVLPGNLTVTGSVLANGGSVSYLPLSGGTLTGSLNAVGAYFSGNVGIGVAATSDRLTVSGNTTVQGSVNISSYLNFTSIYGGYINGYDGTSEVSMTYSASQHRWYTSGAVKMTLTGAGNLGLGTTNPTRDVGTKSLAISGAGSLAASLDLYGNVKNYAIYTGGSGGLGIYDLTDSVERMSIATGGQLLLGTDSLSTGLTGSTLIIRASSSNVGQTAISIQGYDKKARWAINGQNGTNDYNFAFYSSTGIGDWSEQMKLSPTGDLYVKSTVTAGYNKRPADQGYGGIDFYNNGFGYSYAAKFYTFKSPDQTEMYGITNDYGGSTAAELAIVAKQSTIGNIGFYTGNSTDHKMKIHTSGIITKPYQPAFSAYGPGGGPNTRTTGAFNGFSLTRSNRGGHYNTSTGRFTAPIAGLYEFVFSLLWRQSSDTASGEISLGVNGSNISSRGIAYTYAGAANDFHDQTVVRAVLSLNAGDYVTGWIHSSGASTGNWYYGDGLGFFSGHLLG